ncbi:hypothetical protein MRX96_043785 [Rhipicephalus microplus]
MQKGCVQEEDVEVGRAAITTFNRVVRGCEPRVLCQSRYAGVTGHATVMQRSHTAAVAGGEVAILSPCDASLCETK